MDATPKTLEELMIWVVCSALIAMCAAMGMMYRRQISRERGCERTLEKMQLELNKLRDLQLSETREMVRDSTKAALKGEERERLLSKMVAEVMAVMSEQRDVIYRAVRLLRRYDPDVTPPPEAVEAPDFEHKKEPIKNKKQPTDDDTSAIFRPTEDTSA